MAKKQGYFDGADPAIESESSLPKAIRMKRPHGFIGDDGKTNHWGQGLLVTDPAHIEILSSRKAEFSVEVV